MLNRRIIWFSGVLFLGFSVKTFALPVVSDVMAQQRPGTNVVDITYTLASSAPARVGIRVSADGGDSWNIPVILVSGDIGAGVAAGVSNQIVWDAGTDWAGYVSTQMVVDVFATPEAGDYLMIDLADFSVDYLASAPVDLLSSDLYRTNRVLLRRIPSGLAWIGSPVNETGRSSVNDESRHFVRMTKDYYLGVFEFTQGQWEGVMSNRPSYFSSEGHYAGRPVEQVLYDDIRGSAAGSGWPLSDAVDPDSFMGRLRAATGISGFDLPTEAQWEYACRAMTMTALNTGLNLSDPAQCPEMDAAGRYRHNGGAAGLNNPSADVSVGTARVGSYPVNAWGLYDMHGNVAEWCLDWFSDYSGDGADSAGALTGDDRVVRGGSWNDDAQGCRSADRYSGDPSFMRLFDSIGFRLAKALPSVSSSPFAVDLVTTNGWDAGYFGLGGGWRRLPWFGDYVPTGGGWFWHSIHSYFFPTSTSFPESIYLYTMDMGWLFTRTSRYPYLYRFNDQSWLWYLPDSSNPRWFNNLTQGMWEQR